MTQSLLTFLSSLLSSGIFYATFCRTAHMRSNTPKTKRVAYSVLGAMAAFVTVAPLIPSLEYRPDFYSVLLYGAFLVVMVSMRDSWRNGMPTS